MSELQASDLVKSEIEIKDIDGNMQTVTAVSDRRIAGLCVTSCNVFGEFDITHTKTGMSLCRGFERMWEAFLYMVELHQKSIEHDFKWNLDKDDLTAQRGFVASNIASESVMVSTHNAMNQFPWEDRHPCDKAQDIMDGLKDAKS